MAPTTGPLCAALAAVLLLMASPACGWRCYAARDVNVAGTGPFSPFAGASLDPCRLYGDGPRVGEPKPRERKGHALFRIFFDPAMASKAIDAAAADLTIKMTFMNVRTEVVVPAGDTRTTWHDLGGMQPIATINEWQSNLRDVQFECSPACPEVIEVHSYVAQCDCRDGERTDGCDLTQGFDVTNEYSCLPCEPGTYQDEWAQPQCKPCGAGTQQPLEGQNSTEACRPCELESTYSEGGVGVCGFCPSGTTNNADFTACEDCPAGTVAIEDGAACQLCSSGYIATSTTTCDSCGDGRRSNVNRTACVDCEAGTYANQPTSTCTLCPKNTFMAGTGASSCTPCGLGSYQDEVGATEGCDACPAGTFAFLDANRRGTCGACPAGQVQPDAGKSECQVCGAGTQPNEARTECEPCPEGTSGSTSSRGVCEECDGGLFQDKPGQDRCAVCPGGTASEPGATGCDECPTGTFSRTGAAVCLDCPEGETTDGPGQQTCAKCTDCGGAPTPSSAARTAGLPALAMACIAAAVN